MNGSVKWGKLDAGGHPADLQHASFRHRIILAWLRVIGFSFGEQPTGFCPWRFSSGDAVQAALIKSRGRYAGAPT
jgi:hypothetical protein